MDVATIALPRRLRRAPPAESGWRNLARGLSRWRQVAGLVLSLGLLPALTAALVPLTPALALVDDLLCYLLAVVAIALVGGLVPAVCSAAASSLLLNWFFTPPLHHWSIDAPQNLLALVLFVLAALAVGAVVHVAARRATAAAQTEALAASNRIRTALLAAVSHDLRTPLSSVKAAVTSLRQTDVALSEADRAELLATIEEGADRLEALIANLLDMSRLQTGSLHPLLRPISLDEVVPMALRGLDRFDEVLIDVPEDLPLVVADPGLLDRVLANLAANALRYSPAGRSPAVVARSGPDVVRIDVVDHGPGVAPADRERVFGPFQQAGDRRPAGGVGLGLAVARGFTEAMDGSLVARDTPGGGLTMRLALPTWRAGDLDG